jgi:hypothetical protein
LVQELSAELVNGSKKPGERKREKMDEVKIRK